MERQGISFIKIKFYETTNVRGPYYYFSLNSLPKVTEQNFASRGHCNGEERGEKVS